MPSARLLPAAAIATVAAAAALGPAARPLAAQQVDVVRGRVTGPAREPVEGARVTVTSLSGGVNRSARTDRNGRFTVTVPGGDGDYFVAFKALGYAERRFQVKRVGDEDFLLADATLQRAAQPLERVTVRGQRPRVGRADAAPDVGGTERAVDAGAVAPDQLGDLAAMAAAQPGVTPVPGADGDPAGFSVLGLPTDANQSTLNGLNLGASALPRDAGVMASLVTSPYDVSVGGFSGARQNIRTRSGTNFAARTGSLFGTAPQLQWSDAAARALGQQSTNVSLGGLASGPLVYDKAFYSLSYQLGRSASPLRSLLDADPAALAVQGVAPDSVRRLAGLLAQRGVPLGVEGLGASRLSDNGSVFASVDLAPPSSNAGQSVNLTLNGGWNRQTPAALSLSEFPAHAGDRTTWNAGAQARHSAYLRNVVLSETTVGGFASHNAGSPYALLPSGQVLVGAPLGAASGAAGGGVRWLQFGGSPSLATRGRSDNLSAMHQLSWFSVNNKHRLKLTTELRRDGFAQDQTLNRLGTFTYQSLDDLAAGRAATYTRQLAPRLRGGSATTAALSLGDSYRRTPRLQFQYGLRLDAHRFARGPAENPEVAELFGVPNDEAPARVYASPRLGFSWGYGTAPQVAGFEGAQRGPRATVRGGVGVFQNTPQATLLGPAIDNTGLPAAVQQLTCVGPAAPAADWGAYGADPARVPDRCADGSLGASGAAFANAAPDVTLFAGDWRAQRSTRANLSWSGPVLGNRLAATVEGTLSANRQLPSVLDLNAAAARRFALADEGGRPVYVRPASIVPATGAVAAADGRVSTRFSRVAEQRSDLRGTARQLQVSLRPTSFNPTVGWSLAYTLQDARDQARGFQSAAGDPRAIDWARGAFNTRHAFNYSLSVNVRNTVTLGWFGIARSGLPYTPAVAGDVNGDGYANDRAFVFDPRAGGALDVADPALAADLRALAAGGGRGAACLRRQLGRVAGRNSCDGPWAQTANLTVSFNPLKVRLPQRAALSFTLSNPLGAADRLLHGSAGLRGWGQQPFPDPTLLYVRGFDAAANRFRYAANPRFGATRPQFQAFRQPATLTAQLRVDLGPPRERQQLTQQLDRGRRHEGSRIPEPFLKASWGTGGVTNPMQQLLRQADTLRLTGAQADSLATMNRRYVVRLDSIWAPLAREWAALPDRYSHDAVYAQYRAARRASVDLLLGYVPAVNGLLTAAQRRKLPPFVASALDPRYLAAVRSGTAGVAQGGMFAGGAGGGGFVSFGPGGGPGGGNVIIR